MLGRVLGRLLGRVPGLERAPHARIAIGLVALRALSSAVVRGLGFRAVSDDDFARVVIAEQFAHTPRLDPSGTSWLPLPFWLNGSAMMLAGRSLECAVAVALVSGAIATLLVYVAGLWLTKSRASAAWGAALATIIPWSARLGVSTVPELPTAALTLLAASAVATPIGDAARPRRIALGALALLAATLSRYEPWFVSFGFVGLVGLDAIRATGPRRARIAEVAIASTSLAGAALWMIWNRHAHGSALHFLDRVSAYRDAIDHGSLGGRVGGYLFALARAEPELVALSVFALVARARDRGGATLAPFRRPLALSALLLATLTISSIRGGAPTHHPERALFMLFLLMALMLGDALVGFARDREGSPSMRTLALVVALVAAASFPVRRWVLQSESYANRDAEVAIGLGFARTTPSGARALLEVDDYGFFAIQAASGRPEDLVADHKIDPARPRPPLDAQALVDRARREGYALALGRHAEPAPKGAQRRTDDGTFTIYDVEPTDE